MYSRILHPTDLSEASIPALKAAHSLAGRLSAELIICFIAHPPMIADGTQLTDPGSGETRDIDAEISAIQPRESGVNRQIRIITIDEAHSVKPVLQVLETLKADLMVIGMHKKKGVSGWVGRSISKDVVSLAHCDVMVVKHHDPVEEDAAL